MTKNISTAASVVVFLLAGAGAGVAQDGDIVWPTPTLLREIGDEKEAAPESEFFPAPSIPREKRPIDGIGMRFGLASVKEFSGFNPFAEVYLNVSPFGDFLWQSRLGVINASDDDVGELHGAYFATGLGFDALLVETHETQIAFRPGVFGIFQLNTLDVTSGGNFDLLVAGVRDAALTMDNSYGVGVSAELVFALGSFLPDKLAGHRMEFSFFGAYTFMRADAELTGSVAGTPVVIGAIGTVDLSGFSLGLSLGYRF